MWLIDRIAEEKITEARDKGELQDLPGEGIPIHLDDDSFVPQELRVGYRLLKNSGLIPAEIILRKDIAEVESLIQLTQEAEVKAQLSKKLKYLLLKLNQARTTPANMAAESAYYQRLQQKLNGKT